MADGSGTFRGRMFRAPVPDIARCPSEAIPADRHPRMSDPKSDDDLLQRLRDRDQGRGPILTDLCAPSVY